MAAPVLAEVPSGSALAFDGNDYVRVAPAPDLLVTSSVTMEAWIFPTDGSTGTQIIVNKEGEYEMSRFSDGTINWAFANTSPGWVWTSTGYVAPEFQWTHVAVVYDAGIVRTYANGSLVHTFAGSGSIGDVYPAWNDFQIGGRQNTTGQRFVGLLNDIRAWNTARTQGQIQALMNTDPTGAEAGLIGSWRFDDGRGSAATDQSTFAHHGALGNGVASESPAWVNRTVQMNGSLNVAAPGLLANAGDNEGDPLTAVLVNGPASGSLTLNADGSYVYAPDTGYVGADSFTYRVSDGTGTSNVATLRLTVSPAPSVIVTPTSGLTTTDSGGTASFTVVLGTSPTADVTISVSSSDTSEGTVSISSLTFRPGNWNVPQTVTITGVDDGVADGNVVYSVITGAAASADPWYSGIAVTDVAVVNNGASTGGLRGTYFDNVNFTGLRVDRLDPTIDFNWAASQPDPAIGSETFSVRWSGEIQPRYTGTYTFYTTSDDGVRLWINGVLVVQNWTDHAATTNTGTIVLTAGQWYSIVMEFYENTQIAVARLEWSSASQSREVVPQTRLRPTNTAPVATDDGYSVVSGNALAVSGAGVLLNDTDADGENITASIVAGPSNGTLVLNANGSFTYTPSNGFFGADTFSYRVADGLGGMDTATVTINVTAPPNSAPTVVTTGTALQYVENSGAAAVDTGLTLSDADDVFLTGATVSITGYVPGQDVLAFAGTGPISGSWDASTGALTLTGVATVADYQAALRTVTYTDTSENPNVGARSVRFVVSDGQAASAPGARAVTVTAVNDPPVAAAETYTTEANTALTVGPAAGVLANDGDVDGGPLAASLVRQAANGTVQLFADGSFIYTPSAGFNGTDTFIYAVSDGAGGSTDATVTFQITQDPVPDPVPGPAPQPKPEVIPPATKPIPVPQVDGPVDADPDPSNDEDDEVPIVTPAPEPMRVEAVGQALTATVRQTEVKAQPSVRPAVAVAAAPGPMPVRRPQPRAPRERSSDDTGEQNGDDPRDDESRADVAARWRGTPGGRWEGGALVPPLMTAAGPLAKTLDVMARQIVNTDTAHNATIRSVSQVAMAMTAGYVLWSLRGASLLASLVTSLPLWRSLDPLPILESRADKAAVARERRRKKKLRNRIKREDDNKLGSFVN